MKTIKKTKFTLEKFEVAKLKNMKAIIGGKADSDDPKITTGVGGQNNGGGGSSLL